MPELLTNPVRVFPVTVVLLMAVAPCVPVTSPIREPVKEVAEPAVVAEVALVAVAALPPILRLATGVVEATTNGAVPVVAVEVICPLTVRPVRVPTEVMFD